MRFKSNDIDFKNGQWEIGFWLDLSFGLSVEMFFYLNYCLSLLELDFFLFEL